MPVNYNKPPDVNDPSTKMTGLFSGTSPSGNSKEAGWFGVGQYRANPYEVDQGAVSGGPEMDAQRQRLFEQFNSLNTNGRAAPTMNAATLGPAATMDQAQQGQFRDQQMALAQALQAQANGQGPSLAQSQLTQATDRNLKQALALQASQRGANPAAQMRQISQQTSQINGDAARQSADLRAQEQMSARGQLGAVLGNARQQDIGVAGSDQNAQNQFALQQAAMQQQAAANNLQSQNQTMGLNDQQMRAFLGGLGDLAQKDRDAAMKGQEIQADQNAKIQGINNDAYNKASDRRGKAAGGIGQAIVGMLAHGGKVPGKAKVAGDSLENDVVHTMLSPGEVVIPRSIVGDDKKVLAFVRALREKHAANDSHEKKLAKVLGRKRSA